MSRKAESRKSTRQNVDVAVIEQINGLESQLKLKEKSITDMKKEISTLNTSLRIASRKLENATERSQQQRQHADHALQERKQAQQATKALAKELSSLRKQLSDRDQQLHIKNKGLEELEKKVQQDKYNANLFVANKLNVSNVTARSSPSRSSSRSIRRPLGSQTKNDSKGSKSSTESDDSAIRQKMISLQRENKLLQTRMVRLEKRLLQMTRSCDDEKEAKMREDRSHKQEVKVMSSEIQKLRKQNRNFSTEIKRMENLDDRFARSEASKEFGVTAKNSRSTTPGPTPHPHRQTLSPKSPMVESRRASSSKDLLAQANKAKREMERMYQSDQLKKDKKIAQLRSKLKQSHSECHITDHQRWKTQLEDLESEILKKEVHLARQQSQISELEGMYQQTREEQAKTQEEANRLEKKLAHFPNPEIVQELKAENLDLQKTATKLQNKLENVLKRRSLRNANFGSESDKQMKELQKKAYDMEWALHYGDTQKDREVQKLKNVLGEEATRREQDKNRVSERDNRLKTTMRKYQQTAVEEWLFRDGDIALF